MVELGLILGIFSFVIFGLGLLSLLTPSYLIPTGCLLVLVLLVLLISKIKQNKKTITSQLKEITKEKLSLVLLCLVLIAVLINLIGVFGPELSFDALWYHLTLPKIYLQNQKIFYVPGGLFYYSAMPKLTEMFYLLSLIVSPSGTLAKFIHFSFGLFSCGALFLLAKRLLKTKQTLMVVVLFYLSLVVGWESISGYVDLARTFFEILALFLFLKWQESVFLVKTQNTKQGLLIESGIMLGLAVSTKLLSLTSVFVFLILIWQTRKKIKEVLIFGLIVLLTSFPWLIFSFLTTGNPFFPVFSGILDQSHGFLSLGPLKALGGLWQLFYHPKDLSSPMFLIFLPFVLLNCFKKPKTNTEKTLFLYFILTLLFWVLTPQTGGFRFYLPYLPVLCLLIVVSIQKEKPFFQKAFLVLLFATSIINLSVRLAANYKFVTYLLNKQSKDAFLLQNLNFDNNDFYDPGGKIKKIVKDDLVLVFGSHNLFYADFNFIHQSFAQKNIFYSYILTQNQKLAAKYQPLRLIYQNPQTKVNLYLYGGTFK